MLQGMTTDRVKFSFCCSWQLPPCSRFSVSSFRLDIATAMSRGSFTQAQTCQVGAPAWLLILGSNEGAYSCKSPHSKAYCLFQIPTSGSVSSSGSSGATWGIAKPASAGIRWWARHLDEGEAGLKKLRFGSSDWKWGLGLSHRPEGMTLICLMTFARHLLVLDEASQAVIGTYRVLTPAAQAQRVGGTYSDTEFDLTRLRSLRSRMVELGRSCVHPRPSPWGCHHGICGGAG